MAKKAKGKASGKGMKTALAPNAYAKTTKAPKGCSSK